MGSIPIASTTLFELFLLLVLLIFKMSKSDLNNPPVNEEKIEEAFAIISSVGFWEKEIHKQMTLLEEAVNNNNFEDMVIINNRIKHLFGKAELEYQHADEFIKKYGKDSL